ncbi:MAG: Crp/Fnr family transcriptional regulator [Lachnospiraceae bacterium]|nr:Crp/Fnr family transcriptional regulator [Lachnospiraceae bacterium]
MANATRLSEADIEKIYLCPLFKGIAPSILASIIKKPYVRIASYEDDQIIWGMGSKTTQLLLVLSGELGLVGTNLWNQGSILEFLGAGSLFGAEYVLSKDNRLNYDLCSLEDSNVLTIDYRKLCSDKEYSKVKDIISTNLLEFSITRSHALQARIYHLAQNTTREKLLAYLSDEAKAAGKNDFHINMDRQDLADYLSVERSAMCAELSRMQKDGLIRYNKNNFTIKKVKK